MQYWEGWGVISPIWELMLEKQKGMLSRLYLLKPQKDIPSFDMFIINIKLHWVEHPRSWADFYSLGCEYIIQGKKKTLTERVPAGQ